MKIVYYKNPENEYHPFDNIVSSDEADIVIKCFDYENEILYIKEHHPDIIIFEKSAIPFAMSVFFELVSSEENYSPKALVYYPDAKADCFKDYESEKSFGRFGVVDIIVSEYSSMNNGRNHDMDLLVSYILSELGISARISGYRYLRKAILISLYNHEAINSITKSIYPVVGKYFRVSRDSVERAMRHAIESVWDKSDSLYLRLYFSRRKKPSNSVFISAVSEDIRNHYGEEIEKEIEIIESCKKYARRKRKCENK